MDIFQKRLIQLIEDKDIGQKEVAEKTGITEATISRYITGKMKPTMKNAQLLADFFGVSIDYLSGGTSSKVTLNKKDEQDIAKRIEALAADLANQENLMLHGEIMDDETRELLKASLETAVKMSKIKAKEKFTPNKYKK